MHPSQSVHPSPVIMHAMPACAALFACVKGYTHAEKIMDVPLLYFTSLYSLGQDVGSVVAPAAWAGHVLAHELCGRKAGGGGGGVVCVCVCVCVECGVSTMREDEASL
jgi:hypothetical protein